MLPQHKGLIAVNKLLRQHNAGICHAMHTQHSRSACRSAWVACALATARTLAASVAAHCCCALKLHSADMRNAMRTQHSHSACRSAWAACALASARNLAVAAPAAAAYAWSTYPRMHSQPCVQHTHSRSACRSARATCTLASKCTLAASVAAHCCRALQLHSADMRSAKRL